MKSTAILPLLLGLALAGCSKQPHQTVRQAGQKVHAAAQSVEDKAALALHSATGPRQAGTLAQEQKPSAAAVAKPHRRRR